MPHATPLPAAPPDAHEDVRWLSARELAAWRAFAETVHDLLRSLELDLAEHRLTLGDYQVLVELSEAADRSMRYRLSRRRTSSRKYAPQAVS